MSTPAATEPGSRLGSRSAHAVGRRGIVLNVHTLDRPQTIRVVDVLSRWFEFIPLPELQGRLEGGGRLPFCVLTFDDGKKSNATVSAPVLHSLGVPAVFYVVTDFLSGAGPLWFDSYRALLRRVETPPEGLEPGVMKLLPHAVRNARLNEELRRHEIVVPGSADVLAMSWDEARALARQGFTVGAHGLTHAILTRESRDVAFGEIERSLARVSSELGEPCHTFAFPNGNHDDDLARHAAACGATTVMTTDPGWVGPRTPLWRLPRVQVYQSSTPVHIRLKVALAAVPGVLQNPDGTGRAYGWRRYRENRSSGR